MSLVYRQGTARDRVALDGLLRGLSPESGYGRFQAALGSAPPPAVVDALLPNGVRGGAVLAWDGEHLVGHGVWVRLGASRTAEVALVVADSHQRQGVGTVLAERLLVHAGALGIDAIEVFSETGNRAVARMVARHAPEAARERDGLTVTYAFELGARAGTAPRPPRVA